MKGLPKWLREPHEKQHTNNSFSLTLLSRIFCLLFIYFFDLSGLQLNTLSFIIFRRCFVEPKHFWTWLQKKKELLILPRTTACPVNKNDLSWIVKLLEVDKTMSNNKKWKLYLIRVHHLIPKVIITLPLTVCLLVFISKVSLEPFENYTIQDGRYS